MKNKVLAIFCVLLTACIGLASCEKLETYSEIPQVEFTKIYLADTLDALGNHVKRQLVYLEIIDGDGNLGLNSWDTTGKFDSESVFYHNLFMTLSFKNSDGSYTELEDISQNLRYRVPYKEPIGQNKYLKAEVKVTIEIPREYFDYDTVRYEFYAVDRDFNYSNTASSCDIPARCHGTVYADGSCSLVSDGKEQ